MYAIRTVLQRQSPLWGVGWVVGVPDLLAALDREDLSFAMMAGVSGRVLG